jgi:hypothetical protein
MGKEPLKDQCWAALRIQLKLESTNLQQNYSVSFLKFSLGSLCRLEIDRLRAPGKISKVETGRSGTEEG